MWCNACAFGAIFRNRGKGRGWASGAAASSASNACRQAAASVVLLFMPAIRFAALPGSLGSENPLGGSDFAGGSKSLTSASQVRVREHFPLRLPVPFFDNYSRRKARAPVILRQIGAVRHAEVPEVNELVEEVPDGVRGNPAGACLRNTCEAWSRVREAPSARCRDGCKKERETSAAKGAVLTQSWFDAPRKTSIRTRTGSTGAHRSSQIHDRAQPDRRTSRT